MKKNVKFILALALCLLMAAGVVACAAPEAPPPDEPIVDEETPEAPAPEPDEDDGEEEAPPADDGVARITYMFWGDEAEIENVSNTLAAFNAAHPHIYVEPWPVDRAEIAALLTTLAASGELPDTGFLTEELAINWARAGFIQPLEIEGELPRDIISFRWEDEVVAYSSCVVQMTLYYNIDMFDAAGVDLPPKTADEAWTWEEFVDVARTLTIDVNGNNAHSPDFDRNNVEQWGFYCEPAVFQLEMWALSNGGGFFNPDDWTDMWIDSPESAQGIQNIADLYLEYGVMPRWDSLGGTIDSWFLEHNVAMAVNGTWSIGIWMRDAMQNHGLNYSVAVPPRMGDRSVTIATAGLAVVYEGSDHPEAAAEFITWFTSLENNWGLIEGGIWMPRYESWSRDEGLMRQWADNENHPPFDDFRSAIIEFSLTNAEPAGWHWVPGFDMLQIELATILAPVWSGDQTAQEALTAGRPALLTAIGAD